MLSTAEMAAFGRGQDLKRYVRAAAALVGLYDDVAIAAEIGRTRNAIGRWWTGVRPEPEALDRVARATGLSTDELTRFVYYNGPPPTLPDPTRLTPEDEAIAADLRAEDASPSPRPSKAAR